MAYATTSAANLTAVLTFIRNTCTANGWTLSGNVLWKGNCYIDITEDGSRLKLQGGTGKDGSNLLTGACAEYVCIRALAGAALSFPMTVEVHVNASPDEVYVVVKYATDFYQLACWGMSDVPGLTGTGMWFHAAATQSTDANWYNGSSGGGFVNTFGETAAGSSAFWATDSEGGGINNSYIHGDVDSRGWHGRPTNGIAGSNAYISPLLSIQPNLWNNEAVLLPFPIYVPRSTGSKNSLVADLKHIRHARIDFHAPEDILTIDAVQWKIYPWYKKDSSVPEPTGRDYTHSGCFAYALRYTGP